MTKSVVLCFAAILSIPFFASSCADLKDADHCYRFARLNCQKSCLDSDEEGCIKSLTSTCHEASSDLDDKIDDCADKLDALPDCAGKDAVAAACADPQEQIGKTCSSFSDCPDSQSCASGICTRSCYYDEDCARFTTTTGGTAYCNGRSGNSGICIGTCQSNADCNGSDRCQPNGVVKTCGPVDDDEEPLSTDGELGDPCDTSSDCDVGVCSFGYCTTSCQTQLGCSGTTSDGVVLSCVRPSESSLVGTCLPVCTSIFECATGSVCQSKPTVEGSSRSVCIETSEVAGGTKEFGQQCTSASECRESGARCDGFCTKSCVLDQECSASSGTRSAGSCVSQDTGGAICRPGCTIGSTGQCEGNTTCQRTTTTSGSSVNVCRPAAATTSQSGGVGAACQSDTNCNQAMGLSCAYGMCSVACDGKSCPAAAPGRQAICASILVEVEAPACTITCDETECLPGWVCSYDSSTAREVCKHTL